MTHLLGQGSYGKVMSRDGAAVKKFGKLQYLVQEYVTLLYMRDCEQVVTIQSIDLENLELTMDLYDCSLRQWLQEKNYKVSRQEVFILLRAILLALVSLQDRNLAHGDLKPGNILIRREPFAAVLGDFGFVSVAKYAKVERTAAIYRDPVISYDSSHDMYSLGVCLLEMIGGVKLTRQAEFNELYSVVKTRIRRPEDRELIQSLIQFNKRNRPDARQVLAKYFNSSPEPWAVGELSMCSLPEVETDSLRALRASCKKLSLAYRINRSKKGYLALLLFLEEQQITHDNYELYKLATLFILASVFGKGNFTEEVALRAAEGRVSKGRFLQALTVLLANRSFVTRLLTP